MQVCGQRYVTAREQAKQLARLVARTPCHQLPSVARPLRSQDKTFSRLQASEMLD